MVIIEVSKHIGRGVPFLLLGATLSLGQPQLHATNTTPVDVPWEQTRLDALAERLEAKSRDSEKQIERLSALSQARMETLDQLFETVTWICGMVVAVVGIVFGVGTFLVVRTNAHLAAEATRRLGEVDGKLSEGLSRCKSLETQMEEMAKTPLSRLEEEYDRIVARSLDRADERLNSYLYYSTLRIELRSPHPHEEVLFPCLTVLVSSEQQLWYGPVYEELIGRPDLGRNITEKANEGLKKWQKWRSPE